MGRRRVEGGADMLMGVAVKVGVGNGREEGKGAVGDQGRRCVCWMHTTWWQDLRLWNYFEGMVHIMKICVC